MGVIVEQAHKINEKGQCPICEIKPLTYKRENILFCHRCDRAFNLVTGRQKSNFAYMVPEKQYDISVIT